MKNRQYDPLDFVPTPPVARKLLAESQARTKRLEILATLSEQLHSATDNSNERDDGPCEEPTSCRN
jgi:hypothetical protein